MLRVQHRALHGVVGLVVVDRLEPGVDQVDGAGRGRGRRRTAGRRGRSRWSAAGSTRWPPTPSSERLSGSAASRWLSAVVPLRGMPTRMSGASTVRGRQARDGSGATRGPAAGWPGCTRTCASSASIADLVEVGLLGAPTPTARRARRGTSGRRSRRGRPRAATSSSSPSTSSHDARARRACARARRDPTCVGTRKNSSAPASRAWSTAARNASGVKHVTEPAAQSPTPSPMIFM